MSTDLWADRRREHLGAAEPLAVRMRPVRLDQFVGQQHFLGPGKLLRRMLEADQLTSVIFYGPPGCGKTSLAEVIANHTNRRFERANAASVGVRDVREVLDRARENLEMDGKQAIFFLDEIHRFNRAQQDILLGDVERGVITLIGATTENPFFAINSPLVSRSAIFQFEPLSEAEIKEVINTAMTDEDRGYGRCKIKLSADALDHWATACDGDARRALSALEIAILSSGSTTENESSTPIMINRSVAEQSIQRKALVYDGSGDEHYDVVSAFIKSMRGSDPNASVYWLARMLDAGEDPRFIARRIAILASEDIGNADPRALSVAAATYEIVERIGMPECQLTLSQAAIYMATAPKSNASAQAIWTAMKDVREGRTLPVPKHLRDGHYPGAKQLGHAEGYRSSHQGQGGVVDQEYLGVDKCYYVPSPRGYERKIEEYLRWVAQQK